MRWGSWITAALYYSKHLESIRQVDWLESNDPVSIEIAQNILSDEELKGNLSFILPHFSTLPAVIKTLETAGLPISKSLNVFDTAISDLKSIPGGVG